MMMIWYDMTLLYTLHRTYYLTNNKSKSWYFFEESREKNVHVRKAQVLYLAEEKYI